MADVRKTALIRVEVGEYHIQTDTTRVKLPNGWETSVASDLLLRDAPQAPPPPARLSEPESDLRRWAVERAVEVVDGRGGSPSVIWEAEKLLRFVQYGES